MSKQQRLVLIISIMASFVGALDGFIVNVALPTISRNLGGGLVVQQWVVDAYLITLGSLILIAGSLSDLFGRKRILTVGLMWFGITSLLCALAPNGIFLIIARGLQGIAGALLVPSSLAMIISAFSGKAQSKAIGTWTAWFSVAAVLGPLLGGVIVSVTSWRWIFAINVVPIAITLWLMRSLDQPERTVQDTKVDVLGAILCAVGLCGAVFALIEQSNYGWSSPVVYAPFIVGIGMLTAFVRYEATTASPMLPVTIVMFLLSSRFGALAGRFGPRFFMAAGPLAGSAGFLLMLRVQPHLHYTTDLLPGVLVFALGLTMTVAPLTSAILGDIEPKRAGIASSVNNAISRIAGLIAIAFIGAITGLHLDIHGFRRALIITAGLLAVGGIISAIGIRNNLKSSDTSA